MKKIVKPGMICLLLLCMTSLQANAQKNFRYQAGIEEAVQSGFCKINLQPALIAKSKADLSDLRISDEKGNFVPYIGAEELSSERTGLLNFPLEDITSEKDTNTVVIAENKNSRLISQLWLKFKNTAVSRSAELLGSDDRNRWFAISEDIILSQASSKDKDNYIQPVSFPASRYRYFKLIINNKRKSPVKVLEAGIYIDNIPSIRFIALPAPAFSKKDSSDKITYITVKFKDDYQLNKLNLKIAGPEYFNRKVLVFELRGGQRELVTETSLSSGPENIILLSSRSRMLEIQIINGDNSPLKIDKLEGFQRERGLISYLRKGTRYHFLFGDKNAQQPDYDLKFFTDSTLKHAPEIRQLSVGINPLFEAVAPEKQKDLTLWLWAAILAGAASLGFLTWKMMKEMQGRREE